MSETPRPLWELVEKWLESEKFIKRVYAHPQDYSDTKQEGRGEAIGELAKELAAALRAWDEHLTVQIVGEPTNTHIKQQLLGVPPKEPAGGK